MNGCVYKTANGQCEKFSDPAHNTMSWCLDGPCGDETPSNADRIRSMTEEELAIWISSITWCEYCPIRERCDEVIQTRFCKEILLDWLKSPVEVQMSETVAKRRDNLRLMWIAEDKWLKREPPIWKFWAWWRWKRERPVWEEVSE